MQAYFYAFTLATKEQAATSMSQFLDRISNPGGTYSSGALIAGAPVQFREREYVCGVIIRNRTSKRMAFQRQLGQSFRIEAKDILQGTNDRIVDLNFFLVDREKARGIYQQHHHGMSLSQFLLCLNTAYVDQQTATLQTARLLAAENGSEVDPVEVARHQLGLTVAQITNRDGFERMVQRFQRIKSLEVEVYSVGYEQPEMTALQTEAKTTRQVLKFKADSNLTRIKEGLREAFRNRAAYKKLKAEGIRHGGLAQTVKFDELPERLGAVEFDTFLADFRFDSDNWANSLPLATPIRNLLHRIVEPDTATLIMA